MMAEERQGAMIRKRKLKKKKTNILSHYPDAVARFSAPIALKTLPRCLASSSTIPWEYVATVSRGCTTIITRTPASATSVNIRTKWRTRTRRLWRTTALRYCNRWYIRVRGWRIYPRRKTLAAITCCKLHIRKHNRPSQQPQRTEGDFREEEASERDEGQAAGQFSPASW